LTPFERLTRPYDLFMLPLEWLILRRLRRRAIPRLRGRVLEIGVGTGVNLPLYDASVRLVATEPGMGMLGIARRRGIRAAVTWVRARAEGMPFGDRSFDGVVATLVLCSVGDPLRAMQEAQRVLRPGGRLLLIEHMRGSRWWARLLTDYLAGPWYALNGNCHLNRETLSTVAAAGLHVETVQEHVGGVVRVIRAVA